MAVATDLRADLRADPVLDAVARAPLGEEDMTPEQQAEFTGIVAAYEAGRVQFIAHDEVPVALEEIARAHGT